MLYFPIKSVPNPHMNTMILLINIHKLMNFWIVKGKKTFWYETLLLENYSLYAVTLIGIYDFFTDDFSCLICDVVHRPHPLHHIGSFECFGDTFSGCKLFISRSYISFARISTSCKCSSNLHCILREV